MAATGFEPASLIVKTGATVTWEVQDESHSAHWIEADPYPNPEPSSLSSGRLLDEGNFSYTFAHPGTYHYHDRLDPTWVGAALLPVGRIVDGDRSACA